MNKILNIKVAIYGSLIIFCTFILFHLIVIIGIAKYDFPFYKYLWGGKMTNNAELMKFEIVSIVIQIFCASLMFLNTKINNMTLSVIVTDDTKHINRPKI
jgi:hypothetical protein